jgi:hypothetical protein
MGLIKNILGGIFSLLGGIFKIFKKSEYYLESDTAKSGVAASDQPKPAATPSKSSNADVSALSAASANSKVDANSKVGANSKAPDAPVALAAASNSKSKSKSKSEPKVETPAPVAPQPTQATSALFAANLVPTSTAGRRRPGPSLGRYMDMAKDVNMK